MRMWIIVDTTTPIESELDFGTILDFKGNYVIRKCVRL